MPEIGSREAHHDPTSWWQTYFTFGLSWRNGQEAVVPEATSIAYTIPWLLFILVLITSVYSIVSNEYFFERLHEKALARARTQEEREAFEQVREGTEAALKNPAIRLAFSVEIATISVRTLGILLVVVWVVCSALSSTPNSFRSFFLMFSSSTSILSLGVIVHTLMTLWLQEEIIGLSPMRFFEHWDSTNPVHFILARMDVFTVWFFWVCSIQVSRLFHEKALLLFTVFVSTWLILLLVSFLVDWQAYLLPT